MPVDEVIEKTVQLGVSAVELRSQPIELFMGVPMNVLEPGREKPAQAAATEALRAWRLKADPRRRPTVQKEVRGGRRQDRRRQVRRHLRLHRSGNGLRLQSREGGSARARFRASSKSREPSASGRSPTSTASPSPITGTPRHRRRCSRKRFRSRSTTGRTSTSVTGWRAVSATRWTSSASTTIGSRTST